VMGARGRRIAERYHEHVLKTPTETRNALKYVLRNRAHHLARQGRPSGPPVDRFSSESSELSVLLEPPESWLLRTTALRAWTSPAAPAAAPVRRRASDYFAPDFPLIARKWNLFTLAWPSVNITSVMTR
jgi:hypothetical protein